MAEIAIAMPKLSDSMEEATVLAWLKRPGDAVTRGEPLVEVETDKATIVYEAEQSGVLGEIVVDEGSTAALGAVIAVLTVDEPAPASSPASTSAMSTSATPMSSISSKGRDSPPAADTPVGVGVQARARATPVARRLAGQLGVPLSNVVGTGPGGRIVRADVCRLAGDGAAAPVPQGRGEVTELGHTPTQQTIARRMSESRSTIPEFTLETEVLMDAAVHVREDLRFGALEPLPSFNDFVVRAVAVALREQPALNSSYADGRTLRFGRINIGIAVASEDALIVPTIFDADRKTLSQIAAESRRLAAGARGRTLGLDDLTNGTFTVSNLGMYGVRRFNAVISHPQAAILAVGEVAERPIVEGGQLRVGNTMELALSCDHRVVYGAEAARFLSRLRALLEHPALLISEPGGPRDG
jgi:pyruvate dehydrogenase E2 component (dihydrolipoamide acetyltransferase)